MRHGSNAPSTLERQPKIAPVKGRGLGLPLVTAAVFGLALIVRVAYAYSRPIPMSADAAYYVMVAENLYHGHGFVASYAWNYLAGLPDGLPIPSNAYWMPGTSAVAAVAFGLARETSLRAAQWPSLIFGALLCAITAWVAEAITRRREAALLAGLAASVNYYLVELSLYPDHFMLNAVLVNLSLLALWAAWRGAAPVALVAGMLAGLAYLTRTDGGLLIGVALLLALGFRRRARRSQPAATLAYFVIAFVLVAAPWWVRQTIVFGQPTGANALRTASLTQYNDLFRLDQSQLTLGQYLEAQPFLAMEDKVALMAVFVRILAKAVLLAGLFAIGALFLRGQRQEATPWLIYLVLGVTVPALLVPFPALRGGFWHLMPALIPAVLALGAGAAVQLAEFARARARPAGAVVGVIGALAVASGAGWWARPPAAAAEAAGSLYPPVAAEAVEALGPSPGPALTDNAWGLHHVTHLPCAQFPTDGPEAALKVADAIGARYLITRADATNEIPAMAGINGHPRFQPTARYQAGETNLLVYRIAPP